MISALQHAAYCPRQCGLIHLESVWDENTFTLRGTAAHVRTDEPTSRTIDGVRVERGLPIWSDRLGLVGKADTVEFWEDPTPRPPPRETNHSRRGGESDDPSPPGPLSTDTAPGRRGVRIVPVEYKSGSEKRGVPEKIQLCAQALCLEEMFDCTIEEGAIFWVASKKRVAVPISEALRAETLQIIEFTREIISGAQLPPPADDKRCPRCSLIDACMPSVVRRAALVQERSLFQPRPEVDLP
ncbi:MAG: CRISPR-associated protein Cas4 [Methanoregulaceae archaeon]|nr:CRISPR-associated protein Cas4 [Methanoregulaceae archaeon]